jgi:hypothetical protein
MISICSASFICHLIINLNILHPFSTKKHPGVPAMEAQTMATSCDAFATLIAVTPVVPPVRHYARCGGLEPRPAMAAGCIKW